MRLFFEKRIVIAFVFACTILAVLAILIFFNSGSYMRSGKAITLSRAIVLQAEQALSNAIDIERGQNSYIIAQEPVFLESYRRSIVDIEENIKRLQELVKSNDSQQKRFNELSALVKRKKHFAQQSMAALDSGFTAASVMISSTEGKALLDSIRSKITNIQQEEYNRLDGMIEENQADERNFAFAVTALIVFILAIILFVFFSAASPAFLQFNNIVGILLATIVNWFLGSPALHFAISVIGVLVFAGLILTQSRGFWVAFLVGGVVLFFILRRTQRIRLVTFVSVSFLVAGLMGFVFFKDYMLLIVGGLADRFGTLESALTDDVSLVNRFIESGAVFERIRENPILGYGMGVPFRFYDMTFSSTREDTFIHNGYISLWYRFGIWGLGLMLIAYGAAIWRGFQAMRSAADLMTRVAATAAVTALLAYSLPAITSNPFHLNDGLFMYGVLFGVTAGASARAKLETPPDALPLLRK